MRKVERQWGILTKEFKGKNGKVTELVAVKVEHRFENNKMITKEIPNSTFSIKADWFYLLWDLLDQRLRMH